MATSISRKQKNIIRRIFSIVLKTIIILFLLALVLIFLIQTSFVQNLARKKIQSYLQAKLHTRVEIGELSIRFPRKIILRNIYLEDLHRDTLLAAGTIEVDMSMLKLLSHEVNVNEVMLDRITVKISRTLPDNRFNFAYIIRAFSDTSVKKAVHEGGNPYSFKLGLIQLKRISLSYRDDATGNDEYLFLGELFTHISMFDPENGQYAIPSLRISDLVSHTRIFKPLFKVQTNPSQKPDEEEATLPRLDLGLLDFQRVNADYQSEVDGSRAAVNLENFSVDAENTDLNKMHFRLKNLILTGSTISVRIGKSPPGEMIGESVPKPDKAGSTWKVELAYLRLGKDNFRYDDENKRRMRRGIDYAHLDIKDLRLEAKDLLVGSDEYKGQITVGSFTEKSGLVLKNISALAAFSNNRASLVNLNIRTDRTSIKGLAQITYPSIEQLSRNPGGMGLEVNLERSRLALTDLLIFVPVLDSTLDHYRQSTVLFSARLKGRLKDLVLQQLSVEGLGQMAASCSGKIQGLPDLKNTFFDLDIKNLAGSRTDLENILPPGSIPSPYRLPAEFSAVGSFNGTLDHFSTLMDASTSEGGLLVNGSLDIGRKSYVVQTTLRALDLGYLLGLEKILGKISLEFSANGQGYDYKTMHGEFQATLLDGMIRGYDYKNLSLHAKMRDGQGSWQAAMKDNDLAFDMQGAADVRPAFPSLTLKLQVDTINFHALHLLADTLTARFAMVADFANTNPDSLEGSMHLYHLYVRDNQQQGMTDTVSFLAERIDSFRNIELHSELGNINWRGVYRLTETPLALEDVMNRYYSLPGYRNDRVFEQQWQLNMSLHSSPILLAFVPALRGSDSLSLSMRFNSVANMMKLEMEAPILQYNGLLIHKLHAQAMTKDSAVSYRIQVADAGPEGLHVDHSLLEGWLAHNELFASLTVKDRKDSTWYHIAADMAKASQSFQLKLAPDSFVLNYDRWTVAPDNFLRYDSAGILVHNLNISNQDQSLSVNSTTLSSTSPIQASFSQFRVRTLGAFLNQDSLRLDGTLNGRMEVQHILTNPYFTSDLNVDHLAYDKDTIGNLQVKIDNIKQNSYNTNITLEGLRNHVQLQGIYDVSQKKMEMQLNVGRFDLGLIKAISQGQLTQVRGSLKGSLNAAGDLATPVLSGFLNFDSTLIIPYVSGEPLRVSAERIGFGKDGISLGNLVFMDSAGNRTTVDGNVYTRDFRDYRFDLSVKSRNFSLVNAPKEMNRLFYGKLNLDADMKLSGNLKAPKINADLRVNKQTDFTMVLPSSDPEEVTRQGVVVFLDKGRAVDSVRLKRLADSLSRQSELKGMEIAASIETDSSARFNMIIDERNGDVLAFRGRADLAGGIDKSGKMTLTGNYQLDNGSYNVSLSVLKRKFEIQKGSMLTWTGDPSKASIDIRAIYQVNAPPIDLLQQDISSLSQDEINRYKQRLPFRVNLVMKGELLKPLISFEITLPEYMAASWPEVDNRLNQMKTDESEVNKQVFALLLLNRFVQPNPFASSAGSSDAALIAKQSASSLLSEQLNQLAGSLIKGVDVDVDMTSDQNYYTGQTVNQTEMNVNVSKKLFNERVNVRVGSNFQLEDVMPGQSTSNIAGDISVEYRLSKDGRYSLRVFRKDQYNTIVEGQVVETGLSFVLTLDYNQFKELFQKQKGKKKNAKEGQTNETGTLNGRQ